MNPGKAVSVLFAGRLASGFSAAFLSTSSGKVHDDGRTDMKPAFHIYPTAKHINQLFYNRHAKAGTLVLCSCIESIFLHECLKYVFLEFFAHADSGIGNFKTAEQSIARLIQSSLRPEGYSATVGREFYSV
jgi:hypothetical protein